MMDGLDGLDESHRHCLISKKHSCFHDPMLNPKHSFPRINDNKESKATLSHGHNDVSCCPPLMRSVERLRATPSGA